AVSWVLSVFHSLLSGLGMEYDSGWTWTLALFLLVILIRTLLIPVFVKQIKSQRAMQELQPEIKKLQEKYKNKKDQLSRQAMALEQHQMSNERGRGPLAAWLPRRVQRPYFFALRRVLVGASGAAHSGGSSGALSTEDVHCFAKSSFAGAQMCD